MLAAFFQYLDVFHSIQSVTNISNRSPTTQSCHQTILSSTSVINIDVGTVTLWPHLRILPVHHQKTYHYSESGNSDIWNEMSRISLFNAIWNRSSDLVSWLAQQGRNHETIYFRAFCGYCQLRKNFKREIRDRRDFKIAISNQSSSLAWFTDFFKKNRY